VFDEDGQHKKYYQMIPQARLMRHFSNAFAKVFPTDFFEKGFANAPNLYIHDKDFQQHFQMIFRK
jgi:hypothetical protein